MHSKLTSGESFGHINRIQGANNISLYFTLACGVIHKWTKFSAKLGYCSDFRNESNGIFLLGVGVFFLQTNFDLLTCHF